MSVWLITVSPPIVGCDEHYICRKNPEEYEGWYDNVERGLIEDSWLNYSWTLHLDEDDYESEEDYQEALDNAYDDWVSDTEVTWEEYDSEEDLINEYGEDLEEV